MAKEKPVAADVAEDIFADYVPPTRSVSICVRGDLIAELERLEEEFDRAQQQASGMLDSSPEAISIGERITELQAEADKHRRTFTFQAIGRRWNDLMAEHPPTKEQRDLGLPWNEETFPPAALAASSVDPKLTDGQAQRIFDEWSVGQKNALFGAVASVNGSQGEIPKSNAASILRRASERRSRRP